MVAIFFRKSHLTVNEILVTEYNFIPLIIRVLLIKTTFTSYEPSEPVVPEAGGIRPLGDYRKFSPAIRVDGPAVCINAPIACVVRGVPDALCNHIYVNWLMTYISVQTVQYAFSMQ